jgi:hypothetical protein
MKSKDAAWSALIATGMSVYAPAHPLGALNVVRQQLALSKKALHTPSRKLFAP